VAILFALKNRPSAGLGALVSSKVNQWTLLVGMLPIVYSISAGALHPMALDARQVEEILLTSAQSIFAIVLLCDMEFSMLDGTMLLVLFLSQFAVTHPTGRLIMSGIYVLLTLGMIIRKPNTRQGLLALWREGLARLR